MNNNQKYKQSLGDNSSKSRQNRNFDILLSQLSSSNLQQHNQDQYSTINSDLSETVQIKNEFQNFGYGKGLLDKFVQQKQIQEFTGKLNRLFFSYAFQRIKQLYSYQQKLDNSIIKTQQKQAFNCYKTPTRENLQLRMFNTSEKSYQISTGYTDNIFQEDALRKDQMSTKNFKEIQDNEKDLMVKELKLRLNNQESVISELNYQIKSLNEQFKQDRLNAIQFDAQQKQCIEQDEIKMLEEELLLHQQDNDRLNSQISDLTYQNNILQEKVKDYDKLLKNENSSKNELLQRIKEQQKMIDEKTNKNIELQNELLFFLQNKNKIEEEANSKSIIENYLSQIKELKNQLTNLQNQNEILREHNQVLFQEKEISLCIMNQLEQKLDQEKLQQSQLLDQRQKQITEREKQFQFKIQELESKLKQSLKQQQEESVVSKNINEYQMKLQRLKEKSYNLAFKLLSKTLNSKNQTTAFKKMKDLQLERINHRSVNNRSQSKSPVNKSGNKRDLSPIKDKTYIERRRLVSIGVFLFMKYKKVMLRIYFSKLKFLNKLQIQKERFELQNKFNYFINQNEKKKCLQIFKTWRLKMKLNRFTKIIQNFQNKKYLISAYNCIIQNGEQSKNNQKTMQFCSKLCNFIINLSKKQLHLAFSTLEANRLLHNHKLNSLQIVLVKNLIKQKKDALITYFSKWKQFREEQAIKELANHESDSIQERQNKLNEEVNNFFQPFQQRQTQLSLEKLKLIRNANNNNFESTQRFAIPYNQEWSFRDNKQLSEINFNNHFLKNFKKDNQSQKALQLNECDFNQENMLYSNDIYRKNLSSRSCKSHISSQSSNKSQNSRQSSYINQNGGERSPCISYSDQLLQSNIQNKYLYQNNNNNTKNKQPNNEGQTNSSEQSVYSETFQEQRNFYK